MAELHETMMQERKSDCASQASQDQQTRTLNVLVSKVNDLDGKINLIIAKLSDKATISAELETQVRRAFRFVHVIDTKVPDQKRRL